MTFIRWENYDRRESILARVAEACKELRDSALFRIEQKRREDERSRVDRALPLVQPPGHAAASGD